MPALVLCPRLQQHICRYPYLPIFLHHFTFFVSACSNICRHADTSTYLHHYSLVPGSALAHSYFTCVQLWSGALKYAVPGTVRPPPFFTPLVYLLPYSTEHLAEYYQAHLEEVVPMHCKGGPGSLTCSILCHISWYSFSRFATKSKRDPSSQNSNPTCG